MRILRMRVERGDNNSTHPHECERVIRYMRRVVEVYVPEGDVRLIPMENRVWEQQIILLGLEAEPKERPFAAFVLIW